jgi:hypothetical protein
MPETQENSKQLLDISRSMSEMLKEFKGVNKSLEGVSKVFSPEFAKGLKDLLGGDGLVKKLTEKISKDPAAGGEKPGFLTGSKLTGGSFGRKETGGFPDMGSIKGFFKKGGVAKSKGNYVVGENGPEVVSLPAGSAVIPLNVSDLIDGLSDMWEFTTVVEGDGPKILDYDKSKNAIITDIGDWNVDTLIKKYKEQGAYDANLDMTAEERAGNMRRSAKAVTSLNKLQEKIKSSKDGSNESTVDQKIGKSAGPTREEIETEKKRLIKEDPEFYSDKKNMDAEIDSFIRSYNFNEKSISSLGDKDKASQKIEEPVNLEEKKKRRFGRDKESTEEQDKKEKSGFLSNLKNKREEKKEAAEAEGNAGDLSKKIESGQTLLEGEKKSEGLAKSGPSFFSKISEKREERKNESEKSSALSKLSAKVKGEPENKKSEPIEGGGLSRSPLELAEKKSAPVPEPAPPAPTPQTSTPGAVSESSSPSGENKSEKSATYAEKSSPQAPAATSTSPLGNDTEVIKMLLSQIATSISGPLNVYNPDPFRPDSRRI